MTNGIFTIEPTFETMRTRKSFSLISHDSTVFESGKTLPTTRFNMSIQAELHIHAPE